jgi:hypothetical protein
MLWLFLYNQAVFYLKNGKLLADFRRNYFKKKNIGPWPYLLNSIKISLSSNYYQVAQISDLDIHTCAHF